MSTRQYGVDVASYQPTNVGSYHSNGASFCIVKLTQGTGYTNPKAASQVQSARNGHMYTHAYHYANFGSSVSQAKKEAAYFLKVAQSSEIKISKKRYLWLDWESGSGNVTSGSKSANTEAIMAFMSEIKEAGYKTGLYSGASLMRSAIDTSQVIKRYGTCLWVASYPTMSAVSAADFSYFPSMDGVAIWQFTSNWHGLGVDGNVTLVDLNSDDKPKAEVKPKPKPKPKPTANEFSHVVKVKNLGPGKASWKVRLLSKDGHYTNSYVPQGSRWKTAQVATIKGKKCYLIGKDLWIPDEYVKVE